MREKEARETIKFADSLNQKDDWTGNLLENYLHAKGYLEAIEKAKVLEDGIKEVLYWLREYSKGDIKERLQKAITQWEAEK